MIWAYLGFVFGNAILMGDVDIYLCSIFLFAFRIFENDMMLFVLDWGPPVHPKLMARVFLMPVTVSHFTLEV